MNTHLLALQLMAFQGLLGAFDTIFHHELTKALPQRMTARKELGIHAIRALIYSPLASPPLHFSHASKIDDMAARGTSGFTGGGSTGCACESDAAWIQLHLSEYRFRFAGLILISG